MIRTRTCWLHLGGKDKPVSDLSLINGADLIHTLHSRFACTWIAELVFGIVPSLFQMLTQFTSYTTDSIIFIATLYQAMLNNSRTFHEISLFDLVVREGTLCRKAFGKLMLRIAGVICFAIIFVTNLATVLLFIVSPLPLYADTSDTCSLCSFHP